MIGVVIPTLNAKHHLDKCLPAYFSSKLKARVLIVDSSSTDGTADHAKKMGADVITIKREEFNHGLTRELGRQHLQTDIIVMATPDAYAVDDTLLEKLVAPIQQKLAVAAYGRQIPHESAGFFEAFPRYFNYPETGHIRGLEDFSKYGAYTFFCSDSCAAYCNKALDEIGGFKKVLLGEDTVAVAELLRKGYKVAYVAEAVVHHSHDYSLWQEFQRYFDTGLARTEYGHLIEANDSHRGREFVKEMIRQARPHQLPYAFVQTLSKWMGFQLGKRSTQAPLWFKRLFSLHSAYWR